MLKSILRKPSVQKISVYVFAFILKITLKTIRWSIKDYGGLKHIQSGHAVIFVTWHGRILGSPSALPNDRRVAFLSSPSRDGQIGAILSDYFGMETIWGSTYDRPLSGFREMLRRLKSGKHISITPDGPRGPARKAAPGAVMLSKVSHAAIVPFSWSTSRARKAKSWDRMLFPVPFSKGVMIYGKPIFVSKTHSEAELSDSCLDLEDAVNDITAEADLIFNHPAEHIDSRYGPERVKH